MSHRESFHIRHHTQHFSFSRKLGTYIPYILSQRCFHWSSKHDIPEDGQGNPEQPQYSCTYSKAQTPILKCPLLQGRALAAKVHSPLLKTCAKQWWLRYSHCILKSRLSLNATIIRTSLILTLPDSSTFTVHLCTHLFLLSRVFFKGRIVAYTYLRLHSLFFGGPGEEEKTLYLRFTLQFYHAFQMHSGSLLTISGLTYIKQGWY